MVKALKNGWINKDIYEAGLDQQRDLWGKAAGAILSNGTVSTRQNFLGLSAPALPTGERHQTKYGERFRRNLAPSVVHRVTTISGLTRLLRFQGSGGGSLFDKGELTSIQRSLRTCAQREGSWFNADTGPTWSVRCCTIMHVSCILVVMEIQKFLIRWCRKQ